MNLFLAFLVSSPLLGPPAFAASHASLFERLGGKKGVSQIADTFVDTLARDKNLLADSRLNALQKKVDPKKVKARLSDEICKATGGPCKPQKAPLLDNGDQVHLEMMQWLDVIQDANRTLEKCKVPHQERAELLSLLFAARGQ